MDTQEIFYKTVASRSFPRYGQDNWKIAIDWLCENSGLDEFQIIDLLNGRFPRWAADRFAEKVKGKEIIPEDTIARFYYFAKSMRELYTF